jgi:hypothetical protein
MGFVKEIDVHNDLFFRSHCDEWRPVAQDESSVQTKMQSQASHLVGA